MDNLNSEHELILNSKSLVNAQIQTKDELLINISNYNNENISQTIKKSCEIPNAVLTPNALNSTNPISVTAESTNSISYPKSSEIVALEREIPHDEKNSNLVTIDDDESADDNSPPIRSISRRYSIQRGILKTPVSIDNPSDALVVSDGGSESPTQSHKSKHHGIFHMLFKDSDSNDDNFPQKSKTEVKKRHSSTKAPTSIPKKSHSDSAEISLNSSESSFLKSGTSDSPNSSERDSKTVQNLHHPHKHESFISKIFHITTHSHSREDSDHNSAGSLTCDENLTPTAAAAIVSTEELGALPNFAHNIFGRKKTHRKSKSDDPESNSLFEELINDWNKSIGPNLHSTDSNISNAVSTNSSYAAPMTSDLTLAQKYGHCEEILGKGTQATIRLAHFHGLNSKEKLWAVKEFRNKKKDESTKDYAQRVIGEFCISSSMHHDNVIETVDLIRDEHGKWCEVMEYSSGGDMYAKISKGHIYDQNELFCFLKQILNGISYIHSLGVAHRDIKPENLLLDATHQIVKITDFGIATVVKSSEDPTCSSISGIAGSDPYMAPEIWIKSEYDGFATDVWSYGILFYAMITKALLWKVAKPTDDHWAEFLKKKGKYPPIEKMLPEIRKLLYRILEPDVSKRISIAEILDDHWMKELECCSVSRKASDPNSHFFHQHYGNDSK